LASPQKKRHSKLLARLSREDKDKRRQLEKERREAAATRREKQAAKDADEDEEEFVPVSFGRPATVPSGTGAEADDAAGMFDDDDDDDEAFAAKRLVGGRMKQQRSRVSQEHALGAACWPAPRRLSRDLTRLPSPFPCKPAALIVALATRHLGRRAHACDSAPCSASRLCISTDASCFAQTPSLCVWQLTGPVLSQSHRRNAF